MERPEFDSIKDFEEFNKFYWYREELIKICKAHGLKADGSKIELYKVIEAYFAGEKILPQSKKNKKTRASRKKVVTELTLDTGLIECGFTFGPRFRDFFSKQTGEERFKFNVDMVATAKAVKETSDESFTLGDLLDIYYGKKTYAKYDKSMLQWNKFVHDFCVDEATLIFDERLKVAAALWKIVRESDKPKEYSRELLEKYKDEIFARNCTSNAVYPLSIAEGFQDGNIIFSDDSKTALFWHYCGFTYLSGSVKESFLEKVYQDYFVKDTERRFVLITDNSKAIEFFSDKDDIVIDKRVEYRFVDLPQSVPECKYKVEPISANNYGRIHGNITPTFSWASKERFLKNGFGFVAMDGDKVIAVAFSAAVSSDEVDIGVETDENYRHQGLAKVVADRMCREIISQGKKPVWAHAIANEGSKYTALGVGFTNDRVNTVIRKKVIR